MIETEGYFVAYRCTDQESPYRGVITWTFYESREDFEKSPPIPNREVVERGITPDRGIELARETPVECHLNVAVAESVNSETGEVDLYKLDLRMKIAMVAIVRSNRKSLLRLPH